MRSTSWSPFSAVLFILQLPILTAAWTLRFHLPAHATLPLYNPSLLPSNTHSTLSKPGTTLNTLLTRRNTLEFSNLEAGSYLYTLTTRDWAYGPLRVDVNTSSTTSKGKPEARVDVWQTFWGNEWGNKGEYRGGGAVEQGDDRNVQPAVDQNVIQVDLFPMSKKEYYMERGGFNVLSFVKNPMILMGLFSLIMIVGLPYLMENMDDDTKAEFEEMQKKGITGGAGGGNAAQSIQNFDLAGWMAGKSTSASSPSSGGESKQRR